MLNIMIRGEMEYIIFEDRNPESPMFGAMRVGESGIQFAEEMDADKKLWKWKCPENSSGKGKLENEKSNTEKILEWIYRPVNCNMDLRKKLEAVEKALGFKLFVWQKTFIADGVFRQYGNTTAKILRMLLCEDVLIDFTKPPQSAKERFFRMELLKIKRKLNGAGISTNKVYTNARCLEEEINGRAEAEYAKRRCGYLRWM